MISRRTFLLSLALTSLALASPSPEDAQSESSVRRIVEAIDRYQNEIEKGDYIRVQRAWIEVTKLWKSLSILEQRTVEQRRPGTRSWMESGKDYEGVLSDPPSL